MEELSQQDKNKINAYIEEGRKRFGNELHDVEIFCMGCIYVENLINKNNIKNE